MMWRLATACGLFIAGVGLAGGPGRVPREPSVLRGELVTPYGSRAFKITFKGGEPALVIVSGDGTTYMGLYVYDEHGNCVGKDDLGDKGSHDDLAVRWVPPRTARYRIEVRNFGALPNTFQLAKR
jgi:hypothetical protein